VRSPSLTFQLVDADAALLSDGLAAFAGLERYHHEEDVVGSRCRRQIFRLLRPARNPSGAAIVGACLRPGFAGTGTYDHRNPGRLERYRPGPAFAGAGGSKQPNSPSHNRGCYLPKRSIFTESSHHFHMLVE
jgi:hypothetical protein